MRSATRGSPARGPRRPGAGRSPARAASYRWSASGRGARGARAWRRGLRLGVGGMTEPTYRWPDGFPPSASTAEVVACRACPRLVAWREQVGREKRAAFREEYWGRPVPGFGDPTARLLVVGLAPAAHGGNRTGRVFTGDRSGDWLFAVDAPGRLRQPADERAPRRRPRARRTATSPPRCKCAPPAQQADPRGARHVPAVPRARAGAARPTCGSSSPRRVRDGTRSCAHSGCGRGRGSATASRRAAGTGARCSCSFHAEPAEHVHRQAHPRHARRRVPTRAPDRGYGR